MSYPPPQKPQRNFRDRFRTDNEPFGAADAEDFYDEGRGQDLSMNEHAAGLDNDPSYERRPFGGAPLPPAFQAPTDAYGQTGPYTGPQYVPPRPPQYPPQQAGPYPPQYPPQQAGPYPPQYPPQQAGPYPPQYPPQQAGPYPPQYPPQPAGPGLPQRAQQFQERVAAGPRAKTGTLRDPSAKDKQEKKDGIESLFDPDFSLPCANLSAILAGLAVFLLIVSVMAFLALGSLDRHLGLGIF